MGWLWREYSDIKFVEGIRSGREDVQRRFYFRCQECFRKNSARYDITEEERKDLFQDSFVILWDKIGDGQIYTQGNKVYAVKRGGPAEVPDLVGYFMRIVKNLYLETLRSRGRILEIPEEPDDELWWSDDCEVMRHTLTRQAVILLPRRCREILTMFYYQGMTLDEIMEERSANQSYNGVKTAKSKCLDILKVRLLNRFEEEGLTSYGEK